MMAISSGRSELEELVLINALLLSGGRLRFKSSCLLAFLRNVEPQESAE